MSWELLLAIIIGTVVGHVIVDMIRNRKKK